MNFTTRLILVACAAFSFFSTEALAQDDGCPDRGVKLVEAQSVASGHGNDCGTGISFSYGGITYTDKMNKCPEWTESTPTRQVPDTVNTQEGLRYVRVGDVSVTRQEYECRNCGWIPGFFTCCKPKGKRYEVNTLDHWEPQSCDVVVGSETGTGTGIGN